MAADGEQRRWDVADRTFSKTLLIAVLERIFSKTAEILLRVFSKTAQIALFEKMLEAAEGKKSARVLCSMAKSAVRRRRIGAGRDQSRITAAEGSLIFRTRTPGRPPPIDPRARQRTGNAGSGL